MTSPPTPRVCYLHKFKTTRGSPDLRICSYLIFIDVVFFPKHIFCKSLYMSQLLQSMLCRARDSEFEHQNMTVLFR